jgi:hypothetical protein
MYRFYINTQKPFRFRLHVKYTILLTVKQYKSIKEQFCTYATNKIHVTHTVWSQLYFMTAYVSNADLKSR